MHNFMYLLEGGDYPNFNKLSFTFQLFSQLVVRHLSPLRQPGALRGSAPSADLQADQADKHSSCDLVRCKVVL